MIGRICRLLRMTAPNPDAVTGLLHDHGTTVPTDGATGYETGCVFQHIDGSAEGALYVNEGTLTSCDFNAIVPAGTAELADLSDVGATAYTAGSILVADGDSYEEVAVSGDATLASTGALTIAAAAVESSMLATVTKTFTIPLTDLRCEDAAKTLLPDTPDGDGGTLGLAAAAGSPVLGTSTNNTAATESCMFDFVVPPDYVSGQNITVRLGAYVTAAANAESLADVVAKLVKGGALDSTDLCTTAAKDLKAVVAVANQDFTIDGDATGDELAPGSVLNVAVSLERDDTGGSTAGTTKLEYVQVLVPCRA